MPVPITLAALCAAALLAAALVGRDQPRLGATLILSGVAYTCTPTLCTR